MITCIEVRVSFIVRRLDMSYVLTEFGGGINAILTFSITFCAVSSCIICSDHYNTHITFLPYDDTKGINNYVIIRIESIVVLKKLCVARSCLLEGKVSQHSISHQNNKIDHAKIIFVLHRNFNSITCTSLRWNQERLFSDSFV